MEANIEKIIHMRVARTIDALKQNNMEAVFVPGKAEAKAFLASVLNPGETISVGGSVTLSEIGAFDILRDSKYKFIDRYEKGLSDEELNRRKKAGMTADTFLCGCNAITENGCLYNVDGTGNRVSALIYGPDRVFVFAGYNKIVPSLADAVVRVKKTAAPANTVRLDCDTYCAKHGRCIRDVCDSRDLMSLPVGACENTICCTAVVSGRQRVKNRITVVIIGEELGY